MSNLCISAMPWFLSTWKVSFCGNAIPRTADFICGCEVEMLFGLQQFLHLIGCIFIISRRLWILFWNARIHWCIHLHTYKCNKSCVIYRRITWTMLTITSTDREQHFPYARFLENAWALQTHQNEGKNKMEKRTYPVTHVE